MATLAELTAWRDALVQARAAGTQRVESSDHAVTYKNDAEMAAALRDIERRIEAAAGTAGRGPIRVTTSKGV